MHKVMEQALAVLTPQQRAEWEKLTGTPFKGVYDFLPPTSVAGALSRSPIRGTFHETSIRHSPSAGHRRGAAAYYARHTTASPGTVYRLAPVQRGDVAPTISATGTLEAEDFINVGAQVAGLIVSFGKDIQGKQIDFNSVVEKDTVLAIIDPVPYQAAVAQAEAMLEKSQADLTQFEAMVDQTGARPEAGQEPTRQKAIADADYDIAV